MSLYTEATSVLTQFLNKQGGLKTLAFSDQVSNKKGVYALVVETLKFKEYLDEIIDATLKKTMKQNKLSRNLVLIMVYDLVIGKGSIQGGGRVKKLILEHQNALKTQLARVMIKKGVASIKALKGDTERGEIFPRYARVNAALTTVDEVKDQLKSTYQYELDPHIPNLLVFPIGTDLHAHPLVEGGRLILQDKASCFSALALNPHPGWHVLDACAAPGNKTSHAIALLASAARSPHHTPTTTTPTTTTPATTPATTAATTAATTTDTASAASATAIAPLPSGTALLSSAAKPGRVTAFEIDVKRWGLLKKMLTKAGVLTAGGKGLPAVTARNSSFLDADPKDPFFVDVKGVLVDPTCSGSGMQRIESQLAQANEVGLAEKLAGLAKFQTSLILHAMSFPTVQRVVYSTCSIHQEENEGVVMQVLSDCKGSFHLVAPATLASWPRRGWGPPRTSLSAEQAAMLVRTDPEHDKTNGFFVACFERTIPLTSAAALNNEPTPTTLSSSSSASSVGVVATGANKKRKKKKSKQKKSKKSKATTTTTVETKTTNN